MSLYASETYEFVDYRWGNIYDVISRNDTLWIASNHGLILKDKNGDIIKEYNKENHFLSDTVWALLAHSDGSMWAGYSGGIARISSDSIKCYEENEGVTRGIFVNNIIERENKDVIFTGTWQYSPKSSQAMIINSATDSIAQFFPKKLNHSGAALVSVINESRGFYWFGYANGVIAFFDGDSLWHTFDTASVLPDTLPITAIVEDKVGEFFFATKGAGVYHYTGTSWNFHSTENGMPNDTVFDLVKCSDGRIACATPDGTIMLSADKSSWENLPTESSFLTPEMSKLTLSEDGVFISVSRYGEMFYEHGETVITNTFAQLPNKCITKVLTCPDSSILISTKGGLVHKQGSSYKLYPLKDGEISAYKLCLDSVGTIWVASQSMLYKFIDKKLVPVPENDNEIRGVSNLTPWKDGILIGSGNVLWFYNDKGIYERLSTKLIEDEFIMYSVGVDDQGRIWASDGFTDLGLYIHESKKWHFKPSDAFIPSEISQKGIYSFSKGLDGTLYAGIDQGAYATFADSIWTNFPEIKGNDDLHVMEILEQKNGTKWYATLFNSLFYQPLNQEIMHYDSLGGLPCKTVNDLEEDYNGNLWISTAYGLVCYGPNIDIPIIKTSNHLNTLKTSIQRLKNKIRITFPHAIENNNTVSICDIRGRVLNQFLVKSGQATFECDTNDFAIGIYFLRIQNGVKVLNYKFVLY